MKKLPLTKYNILTFGLDRMLGECSCGGKPFVESRGLTSATWRIKCSCGKVTDYVNPVYDGFCYCLWRKEQKLLKLWRKL